MDARKRVAKPARPLSTFEVTLQVQSGISEKEASLLSQLNSIAMDNKQGEKDDSSNVTGTDNNSEGLCVEDSTIETVVVPSIDTCQPTNNGTETSVPCSVTPDDATKPSQTEEIASEGPLTTPLTYAEDLLPADPTPATQMGLDIDQDAGSQAEIQLPVTEDRLESPMIETDQSINTETEDTPVESTSPAQKKLILDAADQIAQSAIHDAILSIEESPRRGPCASEGEDKLSSDGETEQHVAPVEQSLGSEEEIKEALPPVSLVSAEEQVNDNNEPSDNLDKPTPTEEESPVQECEQTNKNLPPPPLPSDELSGDNNGTSEPSDKSTDIEVQSTAQQSDQTCEDPPPPPPATEVEADDNKAPSVHPDKSTCQEEDLPLPPPVKENVAIQSQVSVDLPSPPPLEETVEQQQSVDEMPAPPPILTISPPEDFPSPPEDISSDQLPSPPPVEELSNPVNEDEFPLPPPEEPVQETVAEQESLPPPPDIKVNDESQETTLLISEKTAEAAYAETGETNPGEEQSQNWGKEPAAPPAIDAQKVAQEPESSKNGKSATTETESSLEKPKNAALPGQEATKSDTPVAETEPLTPENPAATSRGQEAQKPTKEKATKSCCVVM